MKKSNAGMPDDNGKIGTRMPRRISDMKFEPNKSRVIKLLCELDLSQYSMKSLSDLFQYLLGESKESGSSEEFKEAVALTK